MKGYVYILVNSSLPNLVKIGRTTKLPQQRAQELSGTGTPGRYVVAYSLCVDDCIEVEAQMHIALKRFRHTNDREFFETNSTSAVNKLLELAKGRIVVAEGLIEEVEVPFAVTLYLTRLSAGRNLYRLSFAQKSLEYVLSKSFQENVNSLYISYNSKFFYDCELIRSKQYLNVDAKAFEDMKLDLTKILNKLVHKNSFIKIMAEYDTNTLTLETQDASVLSKVFNVVISVIDTAYSEAMRRIDKQQIEKLIDIKRKKV